MHCIAPMSYAIADVLLRMLREDEAAELAEYAILIGVIGAACLTFSTTLTTAFDDMFATLGALIGAQLP